ncbi:hypothetical protein [uncultured Ferrovibrio sp.]|jgi:hypothetical protein|uniref:hypothetical protein n=1 Tax=uncultured Ferrovibrio sp. TaxID=1576913 RepID=UPI002630FC4C|nr:hypothetical protein [uncultured Ferrovibrio sp.]
MPISRSFDETAAARAARDKEFARGLLVEAISVLGSEPEVASVLIGHYIDGTGDIDRLAVAMGLPGTDGRSAMLNPGATPFVTFMRGLDSLCKAEGMSAAVSCLAPGIQPLEEWTPAHHRLALVRIENLMDAAAGSPDAAELAALGEKVASYERLCFPHRRRTLAEHIQDFLRKVRERKPWE